MKKLLNIRLIPLTVIIGFNCFTLFIFYTAPIRWATDNLGVFLFFSLLCQLMVIMGYLFGYKGSFKRRANGYVLNTFSKKKLSFIFGFYTLTFLIKYAYFLQVKIFDLKGMFEILMVGVMNPQLGYAMSLEEKTRYVSWTIYFLISIIDLVFFIIGFIKWKQMSVFMKLLFVSFVLLEIFYWMGRGTNFGVISLITTLAFALMHKLKFVKLNFTKVIGFYMALVFLLFISILIFSYNMYNRAGSTQIDFQYFNLGLSKVNENSEIFKVLPQTLQQSYLYVVSYLAQGYYHTALAFDLDFKSTFLLGNNPSLIALAKVVGIDVWERTYMYRLASKGVDPLMRWHSAYLWYASDISFYGVPFVLGFIGYFFGFSWGLTLKSNDFLSKVVFIILGNMLLFMFANNSYLSSVFYSFMVILPLWYITRVRGIKLVAK